VRKGKGVRVIYPLCDGDHEGGFSLYLPSGGSHILWGGGGGGWGGGMGRLSGGERRRGKKGSPEKQLLKQTFHLIQEKRKETLDETRKSGEFNEL